MKAYLLHPARDFDLRQPPPWNQEDLTQDLALNTLFNAMGQGDNFVFEVVRKVILSGFDNNLETIRHRQDIIEDCLHESSVVRELYGVSVEATEKIRKHYLGALSRSPDWVLRLSIELMESLLVQVKKLREIADLHADRFASRGWTEFFEMLKRELSDEYFSGVQFHLGQLKFRRGVLISAHLGKGNKGSGYVLRQPHEQEGTWLTRFLQWKPAPYSLSIDPRDEGGARALGDLQDRGISLVARALAQAADHVGSFFQMLRAELAFYVGCLNLHEQISQKGVAVCRPSPAPAEDRRLSFQGLYDVTLALSTEQHVVGNDANADQHDLVIVTGANQGGKSTFLRSVGLAQLMMQNGMFAPAETFSSSVCSAIFTHYKREEDTGMKSGKLDEELSRMSDIVDHFMPHSMILFNESFAATNEREGSEIATQILSAFLERPVKMVCVTHLYELARGFYEKEPEKVLFLRAERQANGARTFKLIEAEPLQTSFGEDLYRSIFGDELARCSGQRAQRPLAGRVAA